MAPTPGATGSSPVRSARREERRAALVRAATEAIRRGGPHLSMDALAAEAGITKPILYRYFGDRDGLLTAVAEGFADDLVAQLEAVLFTDEAPGERTRRAIECYVIFIEADPALYRFLAHHAVFGGPVVQGVVDRVATTLARALEDGLRAVGRDPAPARTWAYGIAGLVHMAGAHWATSPSIPRSVLIDRLTELTRFGTEGSGRATAWS